MAQLQKEIGCTVEMLVGSSLQAGMEGDANRGMLKLTDVRSAKVVVATAGAFEHAMCKVSSCPGRRGRGGGGVVEGGWGAWWDVVRGWPHGKRERSSNARVLILESCCVLEIWDAPSL